VLSTVLATLTFGPQTDLSTLPVIILVEVYSSALFFSVAFMLGELVRRSSLAYIVSSGLIVASQVIGTFLSVAYEFSGNALYSTIHTYLPTTIAGSLPTQYEEAYLPSVSGRIFGLILGPAQGVPSETTAALLVGVVLLVAASVALAYFNWADVSRRVS
jgi:ABC-2 type transport system permease protein